jgi:hypothetical protein
VPAHHPGGLDFFIDYRFSNHTILKRKGVKRESGGN